MKPFGVFLVVLTLMSGIGMLSYARWTKVVSDADGALARGDLQQALGAYELAVARFERAPIATQLFSPEYARAAANRLWILYELKRYDDTIEVAERAPAEAAPHFWAGCAFFEKARAEESPEARLGWLARAEDELRKAIDASPGDWDTKYNVELTSRLIAALRKQPKTPPNQMMQLLRPPSTGIKMPRRVG